MIMKNGIFFAVAILTFTLLTGCHGAGGNPSQDSADTSDSRGQQVEADSVAGQFQEPQAEASQTEGQQTEKPQAEAPQTEGQQTEEQAGAQQTTEQQTGQLSGNAGAEFGFEALEDRLFEFCSGAGAWSTELSINSDGTFEGIYHDSDMGDIGADYPNGTRYYCSFTGKFGNLEKVDEFTYKMKLVSLVYEDEPDKEEILDGIRYIYSGAYGLVGGTDFLLYLPGAKLADLPEGYRSWVGYYYLESVEETELPYYGLYNLNEENGFSSYVYEEQSLAERIAMEISFAEESAAELETQIQEASTQADMNEVGAELFRTWDDTLNIVWKLLESELDAETMEALRVEERNWIAVKDEAVKAAGKEFEDSSLQPMAESMKAAELTKERVYELAEYAQ